jgi:hypothetical protein
MLKKSSACILPTVALVCLFVFAGQLEAACRNPNIVRGIDPRIVPAAVSGFAEIKWFGHSFFQITSGSGTRIITDPFGLRKPPRFARPERGNL